METNFDNISIKPILNNKLDSLHDLFLNELKDIYKSEKFINQGLARYSEAISSSELAEAFEDYAKITTGHVNSIENIFVSINVSAEEGENTAIEGLFNQCNKLLEIEDINVRDAALIAAIQKVAHFKISVYGTLKAYSKELDYAFATEALQDAIEEEIEIDDVLSDIAEDYINENAVKNQY